MCPFNLQKQSTRGFTLVELLLVILLVTVLLGVSTLRLNKTHQNARLRQCAETLASQVMYSKQSAILSNRKLVLKIDAEKKEISLWDSHESELPEFQHRFKNPYPVLCPLIEFEVEKDKINIFPTGQVDAYSIRLKDGKNTLLCENQDGSGKTAIKDISE